MREYFVQGAILTQSVFAKGQYLLICLLKGDWQFCGWLIEAWVWGRSTFTRSGHIASLWLCASPCPVCQSAGNMNPPFVSHCVCKHSRFIIIPHGIECFLRKVSYRHLVFTCLLLAFPSPFSCLSAHLNSISFKKNNLTSLMTSKQFHLTFLGVGSGFRVFIYP